MTTRRLVYNSFSGTVLHLVNVVIVFMISPVIIKTLGNRDYGIWELVMSIIGYMGLLDLGVGPALLRYVAVNHAEKNKDDLAEIISTAQIFFYGVGFISLILLLVVGQYSRTIFNTDIETAISFRNATLIFALILGLKFPLTVSTAIIMGVQRHYFINVTRIILSVARAFIIYYFLRKYPAYGLIILAVVELNLTAFQFVIYSIVIKNDESIPKSTWSKCSLRKMREMFTYGGKSATMMLASRIQNASLPIVIGSVLGVSNIVYYSIPNRLVEIAKGFSLAMGFPLTPYFASHLGNSDPETLRESWLQTSLAFQIVTMSMPILILFYGEIFLSIWVGNEYAIAGRGVLLSLVVVLAVEGISPNAAKILMATGHHGRAAILWVVLSVVSVLFAILGSKIWGVDGVALGSSIVVVVGHIVTLKMASNDVGVSMICYFKETIVKLIVPLVLFILVLWLLKALLLTTTYRMLIFQSLIGGIAYAIAVWYIALNKVMRASISEKIGLSRMFLL